VPASAPDSIAIRTATPADFAAIAELTVEAYEAGGHLDGGNNYRETLADVAGRADAGEILVAAEGDDVVGAVLLVRPGSEYSEIAGPGEVEFRMLAVSLKAQGRGIGERLVHACLDRARASGADSVVISARDFVQAALRLYARMGFVRIPERDWSPAPGILLVALRLDLNAALSDKESAAVSD
jgi:predicted N-acetyltransferase YhbS